MIAKAKNAKLQKVAKEIGEEIVRTSKRLADKAVAALEDTPTPQRKPALSDFGPPRWREMLARAPFHVNKLKPLKSVDAVTRRWIRNAVDERAAQEGCKFDEERGLFTVDWVQDFCTLYEGDKAGQPMLLDDWQFEYFMQVFGWVRFDQEIGRLVRRFKRASIWIPKKNAKSPTLAATGLYLLCGDGEMGQKCYTLARDFKQAMISHTHAMEMVRCSERLRDECTVYVTTGTIFHHPTRSKFVVVSGENEKSTEGFNGSLFVDEVHVVDRKLMNRVKRAMISRTEPLHAEFSTAGDNGDGYGFDRYRDGTNLLSGEDKYYVDDWYVLDFSIDQKTKIEDLYDEEKVVSLGQQCNPALGRIIRGSEFRSDWRESVRSQTELRQFAMYRLNLWLKAGANWIEVPDWLACGKRFDPKRLYEYPCVAGLDLSKTRDMTALALLFAVPSQRYGIRPYLLNYFWLPEETARSYGNSVDFYKWSKYIHICKGRTVDYQLVASKLNWCRDNLDIRGIGYDPYNSDKLMDILYNEYGWDEESMTPIKQRMSIMAAPSAEFERLILRREIVHNMNPVMEWQIGHCQVQEDKLGNKMPMKPTKDDYRKIDGIAASVMSVAMFNANSAIMAGYTDSILLYEREQRNEDGDSEE